MKTKLFAVILAGLLLLTATACSGGNGDETDTTDSDNPTVQTRPIVNYVTDEEGKTVTDKEGNAVTEIVTPDDDEEDTTLKKFSGTVYVGLGANLREEPDASSDKVGTARAGETYKATRENNNWYEITVDGETCYITKQAAVDKEIIDSMEEVEDKVIVTAETALNLRKLPSAKAQLVTSVSNSAVLNRIAVGDGWSKVLYTDKEGETTECYVSNKYIKSLDGKPAATTTEAPETTAAPADTEELVG